MWLQEHKLFKLLSIVALCGIIMSVTLHNYFFMKQEDIVFLKAAPVAIMISLLIGYFFIYEFTIYSSGLTFGMVFCLIGDVLLALYDPSKDDNSSINKTVFLLIGGVFFLFGRLLFTFIMMVKPYRRLVVIRYSWKLLLISHLVCVSIFTALGLFNAIFNPSLISISTLFYLFLGFGLPMSYAILRLNPMLSLNDHESRESIVAKSFSLVGIVLFNLSDLLLLTVMFTDWLPTYCTLISDDMYWCAMYLLTISVVRASKEDVERGIIYQPLANV